MSTNWKKIRTEYLTTDTSYRKLCSKYGVSYKALSGRAKKENWVELRNQHDIDTTSKILEADAVKTVDRYTRLMNVTDKVLDKLEAAFDLLAAEDIATDKSGTRALIASLKDIKELQSLRSELDKQEQEARIAKLKRDSGEYEDNGEELGVFVLPAIQELTPPEDEGDE